MSREALKKLIDNVPEENIEPLFSMIMRFVEEVEPLPDEVEALKNVGGEYVVFNAAEYN